jgi:hypothetical protein
MFVLVCSFRFSMKWNFTELLSIKLVYLIKNFNPFYINICNIRFSFLVFLIKNFNPFYINICNIHFSFY